MEIHTRENLYRCTIHCISYAYCKYAEAPTRIVWLRLREKLYERTVQIWKYLKLTNLSLECDLLLVYGRSLLVISLSMCQRLLSELCFSMTNIQTNWCTSYANSKLPLPHPDRCVSVTMEPENTENNKQNFSRMVGFRLKISVLGCLHVTGQKCQRIIKNFIRHNLTQH